jgi:RNA polymerase sigma-70 factor (ECF subfamily)
MRALALGRPGKGDDLVTRLERGEASALGELYDAHHEGLRAFARRLLGDHAAAEDLVHDVFVRLPSVIGSFRGDSSLRAFLIGIAVNDARHHVRAAQRRRAATESLLEQSHDQTARPDQQTEDQRFLHALHRALDTLPLDQRVAFVLCDVEERSAGEAAKLTGAPEATMRTRLFHARKKLRSELEREGYR